MNSIRPVLGLREKIDRFNSICKYCNQGLKYSNFTYYSGMVNSQLVLTCIFAQHANHIQVAKNTFYALKFEYFEHKTI